MQGIKNNAGAVQLLFVIVIFGRFWSVFAFVSKRSELAGYKEAMSS